MNLIFFIFALIHYTLPVVIKNLQKQSRSLNGFRLRTRFQKAHHNRAFAALIPQTKRNRNKSLFRDRQTGHAEEIIRVNLN